MKLDDEIVELKEWDVVRVPPGTWRGYEAGPEGLEIIVIGAPNLGEAPREDVERRRDWWADSRADSCCLLTSQSRRAASMSRAGGSGCSRLQPMHRPPFSPAASGESTAQTG